MSTSLIPAVSTDTMSQIFCPQYISMTLTVLAERPGGGDPYPNVKRPNAELELNIISPTGGVLGSFRLWHQEARRITSIEIEATKRAEVINKWLKASGLPEGRLNLGKKKARTTLVNLTEEILFEPANPSHYFLDSHQQQRYKNLHVTLEPS